MSFHYAHVYVSRPLGDESYPRLREALLATAYVRDTGAALTVGSHPRDLFASAIAESDIVLIIMNDFRVKELKKGQSFLEYELAVLSALKIPVVVVASRESLYPIVMDLPITRDCPARYFRLLAEQKWFILPDDEGFEAAIKDLWSLIYALTTPEGRAPQVFLSYSHEDEESVLAIDQWLRNKGARVDLDKRDFVAGRDIREEIVRCIYRAGKVVCFYSHHSADRYYTKLERRIVEEREVVLHSKGMTSPALFFFRLDPTPLPQESSHRLAINAWGMTFEAACNELWRAILEEKGQPVTIDLNRYSLKAPWAQ